jgi:hypothetical protein
MEAYKRICLHTINNILNWPSCPMEDIDAYDWVEFNLGSPPQRVAKLLELGWKPLSKNTKEDGNPKVDEDSLNKFAETSGNEAGKLLAKWVVINSRANMVNNWLVNSYNEKTGAIHGNLVAC